MPDSELVAIWNDAHHFITSFLEPISFGALHIYASALPFCQTTSTIWGRYNHQATNRILHGSQNVAVSPSLWARSVESQVDAIELLQDGKVIALGSREGSIHLWDLETGTQIGDPLSGPRDRVLALAVSRDGNTLASGSWDGNVCLWNAWTGELLCQPSEGHAYRIYCLAFSPDSEMLVTASFDGTVRFCDVKSGRSFREPVTYRPTFGNT